MCVPIHMEGLEINMGQGDILRNSSPPFPFLKKTLIRAPFGFTCSHVSFFLLQIIIHFFQITKIVSLRHIHNLSIEIVNKEES